MTYENYLFDIAELLGDNEPGHPFERWTKRFMISSINNALAFIATRRSDLFTELAVAKLSPGIFQDLRHQFDNVVEVVAQTDALGNIIRKIDNSKVSATTVKNSWNKPPILVDERAGFTISSAQIDVLSNGRFTVSPAVPENECVYVLVKGFKMPSLLTEAALCNPISWPKEVSVALQWYVMAQAAVIDKDINVYQAHLKTFMTLLQLSDDAERFMESGFAAPDSIAVKSRRPLNVQ